LNYLYGPDPANASPVDSDLLDVITSYWSRNTVRPSAFLAPD